MQETQTVWSLRVAIYLLPQSKPARYCSGLIHPFAQLVRFLAIGIVFEANYFSYLFYKGKRFALLVAASGSADAVHIIVVCLRNIVIDDMADVGNVQTARPRRWPPKLERGFL